MLNILPPKKKDKITERAMFRRLVSVSILVVGVFTIVDALGIGSYLFFQQWSNNLQSEYVETQLDPIVQEELELQITELTTTLTAIQDISANSINPLPLVTSLLTTLPDQTVLTSLTINSIARTITLQGTAQHYEDITTLQQVISDHEQITNVVFPVSSLDKEENIPFEFTGDIVDTNEQHDQ